MNYTRYWRLYVLIAGIAALVIGCEVRATPQSYSKPFAVTPPYVTRALTPAVTQTPTSIPKTTVAGAISSPSPEPFIKLPPPLAAVSFPTQSIAYPADWPSELRYPKQFTLVEVTSGTSLQGIKGWGAKLIYQGDPKNAANLLVAFFDSNGWQVIERTQLDSNGFLVLVQKANKQHNGTIVIDPDAQRPGYLKIVATVFP